MVVIAGKGMTTRITAPGEHKAAIYLLRCQQARMKIETIDEKKIWIDPFIVT